MTLQVIERVGIRVKGSKKAVFGSGTASMSLSLIACQPRMLEPSNPEPSSKSFSVNSIVGMAKCCHVPGRSMNLKSTISTLFFLTNSSNSLGVMASPSFFFDDFVADLSSDSLSPRRIEAPVPVGNRHSAVLAKGTRSNLNPYGGLPPFKFADIHQGNHFGDRFSWVTHGHDFIKGLVLLDIRL